MHDALFLRSSEWSGLSVQQFESWLEERAKELQLDVNKFMTDMKSAELVQFAKDAATNAQNLRITGTPFIIVNGQICPSGTQLSYDNLGTVIKLIVLGRQQFTYCPPMTVDTSKTYIATLHTAKGDIVIELFADKAPMTVNSFIFLAKQGCLMVTFHRWLRTSWLRPGILVGRDMVAQAMPTPPKFRS
jgi:hypothetical protein